MPVYRYSRWDGSQQVPDWDADDLLEAMSDELLTDGDLESALRRLHQRGLQDPRRRLPGLRDLLDALRKRRQERLDRFDPGSSLDEIRQALDRVIQTEREGIDRQVAEARAQAARGQFPESGRRHLERLARERREALDRLPRDPGGRLRGLQEYEFMDRDARRQFQELLARLREQMLRPFVQGMRERLGSLTDDDLRRMREMLQDLNRMLRERAEGREPDWDAFKRKWGHLFPGVESLDQLLEQLARQVAQVQSLMQSLTPGQRRELQEAMRALLGRDERLEAAMAQLGMHLAELMPMDELSRRYPFRGDEGVTLEQAMDLMDELQQMDELERALRGVRDPGDLDRLDRDRVERLLGPQAAQDLEQLRELTRRLEDAGYVERHGDELRLTARAIRKIADKALRDIFTHLKRDRVGGHALPRRGAGGDQTDETKRYEFGDPFLLDLKRTVMNALERRGRGTPVALAPDDFEVCRTELRTQASTVVMLDMSRSMLNNGYFLPAKKVALALSALIRGQFPRDSLYIVGFSLYAREYAAAALPTLSWSEWNVGTNMHAGFLLARRLLARHVGGTRQIIMVTDGEPTAHLEDGVADFSYPPSRRTVEETLREVQRCTREGIRINTFMLERSPWLVRFVEELTRINRGRAFFARPERLGEYVLVDYVRARRQVVS